ncbi:hypothetical protein [Legionella fairfieldensis]|uniref:hypothetical protein n=1 Tax=Legionella fairfieldensis TaxID=45064 RepID=UPI00048D3009|nr:hypothetical protein [Legionella fairfieldensis]
MKSNDSLARFRLNLFKIKTALFQIKANEELDKILAHSHDKTEADIYAETEKFLSINQKLRQDILPNNTHLSDDFPSHSVSIENFKALLLRCSSKEERVVLFKLMEERLPQIITKNDQFINICLTIPEKIKEERIIVLRTMQNNLPLLITQVEQFTSMERYLTNEQFNFAFNILQYKLPEYIHISFHFAVCMDRINQFAAEQSDTFLIKLQEKIPSLIDSADDFRTILIYLSLEQRTIVFKLIQNRINDLLQKADDLSDILYYLSEEQKKIVCEEISQEKLFTIIKTGGDLLHIENQLSSELFTIICTRIQEKLPEIFLKKGSEFIKILERMTPDNFIILCNFMQEKLPQMLENSSDFVKILQKLSPDQCAIFCNLIQSKGLLKLLGKPRYAFAQEWLNKLSQLQLVSIFLTDAMSEFMAQGSIDVRKSRYTFNHRMSVSYIAFTQCYFKSLLITLKKVEQEIPAEESDDRAVIKELYTKLKEESIDYFDRLLPFIEKDLVQLNEKETNDIYLMFQKKCRQFLNQANKALNGKSWFRQIAYSIDYFLGVPTSMRLRNWINQGKPGFFDQQFLPVTEKINEFHGDITGLNEARFY